MAKNGEVTPRCSGKRGVSSVDKNIALCFGTGHSLLQDDRIPLQAEVVGVAV